MFLFTTPAPSQQATADRSAEKAAGAPAPVVDAIRTGSQRTGADFGYLLTTAKRESSFDPDARASTSSASGLFQFVEQTWLGMLKQTGAQHGLGAYADAITERGGRFDVADPRMKAQVLALRNDPKVAAVMAGEFTRRNASMLAGALGRQPTQGELYAAHFMGAAGAADLIRAATGNPRARAADLFPDQAASNRGIFYDRVTGQAKSVAEVHATLVDGQGKLAVPAVPQLSADPASWLGAQEPIAAPAYAPGGPAMHGLFRTEGPRGPVNQTVQRLWAGPSAAAAAPQGPRFFPRTAALGATASDAPQAGVAPAAQATVPCAAGRPTSRCRRSARWRRRQPRRPAVSRSTSPPSAATGPDDARHTGALPAMIVRRFLAWVKTAPAEARADAAGALARAWLHAELGPHERVEAEQALTVLLDDPSPWVRQALAEAFGRATEAPPALIGALANDQSDVAAIVLSRSPLLDDATLVDRVATGDALVQTAVAMRPDLPAPVAAALAEVGEAEAVLALVANASAAIPGFSFARIVERHGEDAALRDALMAREDLPAEVRVSVVVRISEAMAGVRGPASDADREHHARDNAERALLDATASVPDADLPAVVKRLRWEGRLTPALVLAAVLDGDLRLPTAVLHELAGMNARRVGALLVEGRGAAFAAVCRKAGLPAGFVPVLETALAARRSVLAQEFPPVGAARRRRIAQQVVREVQRLGLDPDGRALVLLRRMEAEAAREEARLVTQSLMAAYEAETSVPLLLGPEWLIGRSALRRCRGPRR